MILYLFQIHLLNEWIMIWLILLSASICPLASTGDSAESARIVHWNLVYPVFMGGKQSRKGKLSDNQISRVFLAVYLKVPQKPHHNAAPTLLSRCPIAGICIEGNFKFSHYTLKNVLRCYVKREVNNLSLRIKRGSG